MPVNPRISLQIAGRTITGWLEASVAASIERVPRTFELSVVRTLNDQYVEGTHSIVAGTPCVLFANGTTDRLVTGYIDAVEDRLSGEDHAIRYTGRGACEDLESSAEFWSGGPVFFGNELNSISVLQGITRIAASYDVQVIAENPKAVSTINRNVMTVQLGDAAYDGVEYFNKQVGSLLYENEAGALVLGYPGSGGPTTATVITHQTCIESTVVNDLSNVHSDIEVYVQAAASDWANFNSAHVGTYHNPVFDAKATANGGRNVANPPPHRVRKLKRVEDIVLSPELYAAGSNPQQIVANWLGNREQGLSQRVVVTLAGWYDDQGVLWRPNRLVNVRLERQLIFAGSVQSPQPVPLLIVECSYAFGPDAGTTVTLTLMPAAAFAPDIIPIPQLAARAALLAEKNNQGGNTPPATQTGPGGLQGHT